MTEHHALVAALVADIPTGTVWPVAPRERWLIAAAAVFDLVYGAGETVDMREVLVRATATDAVSSKQLLAVEPLAVAIEPGTKITYESEPERKDVILESTVAPAPDAGMVVDESHVDPAVLRLMKDDTVAPDRNVGGRPKTTGPARPAGIPTNLNMALDAIEHHEGKASASQILAYVRRKYWAEAPSNWTASLYDNVNSKKLSRDSINFVRPAEPKVDQKPVAPVAASTPPENRPIAQSVSELTIRFEYAGKSAMLSKVGFRVAEALRRAMGKGHLDYSYLMQAGTAGQRKAGVSEKVWCMEAIADVRPRLVPLGLEITHSPDFGYTMRATAVD